MIDLRKVMAGQATFQREESAAEHAARIAAENHFGGLAAYSTAGSAFRRGFVHAAGRLQDFRGQCENYDAGFEAASEGMAA